MVEAVFMEAELKPKVWWWYIDDIFFIWKHVKEKLKEFVNMLKKKHPAVKFAVETSKTQINFLYVTVSA